MSRQINNITGRMSLRSPQRQSLEILAKITKIIKQQSCSEISASLSAISLEYPGVTDFERDFPSLCFALATGVGKTRLMGAFISYLYLEHGINNFMVLAPNLTIYNKLITDFTANTPKYVFQGMEGQLKDTPVIITGENYESGIGIRSEEDSVVTDLTGQIQLFREIGRLHINIFNISKINSEVRGGKSPRIKRLSEYIGKSYFDYLAGIKNLVLVMDESHRYRASAGVRAINELKPILGLELTATPYTETGKGTVPFRNVIYHYNLAKAMEDGFVKEPAVATQKDFIVKNFTSEQIEEIKLKDGIRLHENTKVELNTYHHETGRPLVKPFMLVIARDTTHAGQLVKLIQSEQFFDGQYRDKVIQVDSSKSGTEEDEMIARLLAVEKTEEPTEIVIHVNMLKEGWDVTNLYTIVPLRAANARVLIEQSIGRGLRLPYGKRTGVGALDRLSIVAHDKFQEIIDEANRPDSQVHLTTVYLDESDLPKTKTIVSMSNMEKIFQSSEPGIPDDNTIFKNDTERNIARLTYKVITENENLPTSQRLLNDSVQERVAEKVTEYLTPSQLEIPGLTDKPSIIDTVSKVIKLWVQQSIDIPRIIVQPIGDVTVGYHPFQLDCSSVHYQPAEQDILLEYLRTQQREIIGLSFSKNREKRLEDYLVRGLMNYNDICYDEQAELLYDLSGQMVEHLRGYLKDENEIVDVLQYHQRQLVELIRSQMQKNQWEKALDYEAIVSKGFTELKKSAYTVRESDPIFNFHLPAIDKRHIDQYLFGGFNRCLYQVQKFQSDTERMMAMILDRESLKWFKPAKGQFQIFVKTGLDLQEYIPDFVAETEDIILMIETKSNRDLTSKDVINKKTAAETWCSYAKNHALKFGGKPWRYVLISHDIVKQNMSLNGLINNS
jgi:type III restriction enzyme